MCKYIIVYIDATSPHPYPYIDIYIYIPQYSRTSHCPLHPHICRVSLRYTRNRWASKRSATTGTRGLRLPQHLQRVFEPRFFEIQQQIWINMLCIKWLYNWSCLVCILVYIYNIYKYIRIHTSGVTILINIDCLQIIEDDHWWIGRLHSNMVHGKKNNRDRFFKKMHCSNSNPVSLVDFSNDDTTSGCF